MRYENQLAHNPGTPNATGAVAMTVALNEISRIGIEIIEEYEKSLALECYDALKELGVEIYIERNQISTVIPFNVPGMHWLR